MTNMSSIERAIQKLKKTPSSRQGQESALDDNQSASAPEITPDNTQDNKNYSIQARLSDQGFLTPDIKASKQLDEYRQIKRPLLMNAFGKCAAREENANLVMITSAVSGEGKTYTTLNLALSMAMERDKTVLMVDCDDVRSSLTNALGLGELAGLMDLLSGEINDVEDIIANTDIPKLSVIPSGKMNAYSTELFASERMEALLNELAKRYTDRIILFDSPPLLETSQTKILADQVGQILVVVEEGITEQKTVVDAISQLDPNKIIGTILNKRRYSGSGEYYGGYYGQPDE